MTLVTSLFSRITRTPRLTVFFTFCDSCCSLFQTAENEGNVRFRRLVRQHKADYIAAEKRIRKDAIAREILDIIASRGGKFLRKVESKNELIRLGVPPGISFKDVWARVDEDTQVQKVKQALRNKDDAGELPPPSESEKAAAARGSGLGGQTVTNELPRGVKDEGNVHRADCNIHFGAGALERASSGSGEDEKLSSKVVKRYDLKGVNSPASTIKKTADVSSKLSPGRTGPILPFGGRRLSGISDTGQAQRLGAPVGIADNMMHRDAWDKSKAAPTEEELRTLQELRRLRMMREQMGVNSALGGAVGLSSAGAGGLDSTGGMYGPNYRGLANAEFRQMRAQRLQAQQLQAQRMAAASFRGANIPSVTGSIGAPLHPSLAMAARQPYMESQSFQRRLSTGSMGGVSLQDKQGHVRGLDPTGSVDTTHAYGAAETPPSALGRTGADSAGERAIGIAQAMKRADAFPPAESLELSYLETIILLTLCSHGLPVWSPDADTKSFVDVPAFAAKRFDWTWCDFASLVKQNARQAKSSPESVRQAGLAAAEYMADPRELATKTVMLIEKVRRHSSAGTAQRKQWSGLGMRVPLWLDRELSRWAMSLGVADPTGRPVPFSVADFAAEHPGCKEDPSVVATAAFDPPLADDVVDQVALLTRLRSVFAKSKPTELRNKLEAAVKEVDSTGDGWQDRPKGWEHNEGGSLISREMLLCDRLLRSGFTGVTSSVSELSSDFQLVSCFIRDVLEMCWLLSGHLTHVCFLPLLLYRPRQAVLVIPILPPVSPWG